MTNPYAADPLGLVAHKPLYYKPKKWKVYACDVGSGYYLPNPQQALDEWGPKVKTWFSWMSGGTYVPNFEADGV